MKEYTLRTITFFILSIVFLLITSCKQRTPQKPIKTEFHSHQTLPILETQKKVNKPKYGFSCGLLDHNGDLWFGSNGGGIIRYDGNHFLSIPINEEAL